MQRTSRSKCNTMHLPAFLPQVKMYLLKQTENGKRVRDRLAGRGSWMAKQFPPANTGPLNPCRKLRHCEKFFSVMVSDIFSLCFIRRTKCNDINDCTATICAVQWE